MMSENQAAPIKQAPRRCQLVLFVPPLDTAERLLGEALAGGDVASVILAAGEMGEGDFQRHCSALVPLIQQAGAAALISGDSRVMGRTDADGIYIEGSGNDYRDQAARFSPERIVGFGDVRARHRALELGEANPDFLLFGRGDGDIKPEPHPKNLALGEWWAQMVEIPCVVMAGSAIESVVECAATGAEFAAASLAVFAHVDGPGAAVEKANLLLEEYAPVFDPD